MLLALACLVVSVEVGYTLLEKNGRFAKGRDAAESESEDEWLERNGW